MGYIVFLVPRGGVISALGLGSGSGFRFPASACLPLSVFSSVALQHCLGFEPSQYGRELEFSR